MAPSGENSEERTDREQQYDDYVVLLSRHDEAIRRFIRYLLPSPDGVDDVMQETALECWKKFASFEPSDPDEFVRWACVIARYKVLSWQRDRSRERLVFRESVIERLADVALDSLDQRSDERQAIERCLAELPSEQRKLVLSVHTSGESIAQLAKETGEKARRLYSKVNVLRTLLLGCVQRRLSGEVSHG